MLLCYAIIMGGKIMLFYYAIIMGSANYAIFKKGSKVMLSWVSKIMLLRKVKLWYVKAEE